MSKEIERKWALSGLPSGLELLERATTVQGYVSFEPEVRLRKRHITEMWEHGMPVNSIAYFHRETCYLTVKQGAGLSRDEYEVEINMGQFKQLYKAAQYQLEKYEWVYALPGGSDLKLEVSVVSKSDELADTVTVAEIEFPSVEDANAFDPAAIFGDVILAEVTHIKDWKNANLASRGGPLSELLEALNK